MYMSTATYCGAEGLLVALQTAHTKLSNKTLTNFPVCLGCLERSIEEWGACAPGAAVIISLEKGKQKVTVAESAANARHINLPKDTF